MKKNILIIQHFQSCRRRSKPHDVIDIASEAQRSSLARNPFPLSRESSGINLRDVIPPPARNLRPKINISKIGKTIQGFNIINKVRRWRFHAGVKLGFLTHIQSRYSNNNNYSIMNWLLVVIVSICVVIIVDGLLFWLHFWI